MRKIKSRTWLVFFSTGLVLWSRGAFATTVSSHTESGPSLISERISVSHKNAGREGLGLDGFRAFVMGSRSETTLSDGSEQKLNTRQLGGRLDTGLVQDFGFSLGGSRLTTPEISYVESKSEAGLFFRHEFDPSDDGEVSEDFRPSVSARVTWSTSRISQDVEFRVLSKTVRRETELNQRSTDFDLSWDPTEWLSLGAAVTVSTYDKEAADLQRASQSRLLQSKARDLTNTIDGLPDRSSQLSALFLLESGWDLNFVVGRSQTFIGDVETTSAEFDVAYHFLRAPWTVGVGVLRQVSRDETGLSDDETTSALFDLTFRF